MALASTALTLVFCSMGGYAFAAGGAASGHPAGWLRIDVTADPTTLYADGKATSSIIVEATDASGDPPADGTPGAGGIF